MSARAVEVLATGPLALVQDRGRVGHLAVGVGRAGAADAGAHLLGGRLLGNAPDAASLEVTFGGLRLRAKGDLLVCLTGATTPATVDGRPMPMASPFEVRDGQELALGTPTAGLRTYVSIRGGIAATPVLGSLATDTMSGLGPLPLAPGQVLPVGRVTARFPHVDVAGVPGPDPGTVTLDVLPGPRLDWFAAPERLASTPWRVTSHSDRVGIRLEGEPLERHPELRDAELPSEGMVRGAIQVPPSGLPVLFLNDHPVTGGYPVLGVLRAAAVDLAAQLVPGQDVRLRWDQ
ncbi:biotin-dependent carboxyltransferase family protein [Janibacter melonis]|uniref:5-oxoprolinase subunit C family protein n=1 Tax=Janibacter melonis TaxID=262209 RepID=UPI0020441723|nr:biotin-dependent carboxyltransferase family protein [Janibacter melonis]MCM3555617.1 biotin-dependent carboxyltransferase family protein [Janibacter melonis]